MGDLPLRKRTFLLYGGFCIDEAFFRRCAGSARCLAHSHVPGTSVHRIAATTVYPQQLADGIVQAVLGISGNEICQGVHLVPVLQRPVIHL